MLKSYRYFSWAFVVGFVLFITWSLSISLYNLFLIPVLFIRGRFTLKIDFIFILLIVASTASFINIYLPHGQEVLFDDNSSSMQEYIPYIALLLFSKFIGNNLQKLDFEVLLFFILIEALITIYQGVYGLTGFWYNAYEMNGMGDTMLYFSRPNGLSMNSSISSQKFMVGFWLLFRYRFFSNIGKYFYYLAMLVIVLALYYSFNRTVLLTLCIGTLIYLLFFNSFFTIRNKLVFIGLFIFVLTNYVGKIKSQFLRGASSIEESTSRLSIYEHGIEFIEKNLVFGNHSMKYFFDVKGYHLHNSYLELIASNGLIISIVIIIMYLILLFRNRNSTNLLIALYSMLQYGVFWGLGIMDIFLFTKIKDEKGG